MIFALFATPALAGPVKVNTKVHGPTRVPGVNIHTGLGDVAGSNLSNVSPSLTVPTLKGVTLQGASAGGIVEPGVLPASVEKIAPSAIQGGWGAAPGTLKAEDKPPLPEVGDAEFRGQIRAVAEGSEKIQADSESKDGSFGGEKGVGAGNRIFDGGAGDGSGRGPLASAGDSDPLQPHLNRFNGFLQAYSRRRLGGKTPTALGRYRLFKAWMEQGAGRSLDEETAGLLEGRIVGEMLDNTVSRFLRYARSLMGDAPDMSREPRGRREERAQEVFRSLFVTWTTDEAKLSPSSMLAMRMEDQLFTRAAAKRNRLLSELNPRFHPFGDLVIAAAEDYGVSVAEIDTLLTGKRYRGVINMLGRRPSRDTIERTLNSILRRNAIETLVADYPENPQGDFLRSMGQTILTPGGKSIEEISRAGAFAYVNFRGSTVNGEPSTGRDPDAAGAQVVFYIVMEDGRWKPGVYRQNRRTGPTDAYFVEGLAKWLITGGIPADHLAF